MLRRHIANRKRAMQYPAENKPAPWGAVSGAKVMAIFGCSWGGRSPAASRRPPPRCATSAVTAALTPVCLAKFQGASDASTNLAALKKADTWQQGDFVEKGGWATMPGATQPPEQLSAVAKACATLLLPA